MPRWAQYFAVVVLVWGAIVLASTTGNLVSGPRWAKDVASISTKPRPLALVSGVKTDVAASCAGK